MIPDSLLQGLEDNDCHTYFKNVRPPSVTPECTALFSQLHDLYGELNWYDLYRPLYPTALKPKTTDRIGKTIIDGEERTYIKGYTQSEYAKFATHISMFAPKNEAVFGAVLTDYMNRADVREAFNIPSDVQAWEASSKRLEYLVQNEASQWIYEVMKGEIPRLFYSGDTDGAITTYGSKLWIKDLGWDVLEAWRPWYFNGQVGGYVERYDGLDFVTVKGVGHMAPQWKREEVQKLVTNWILDNRID